MACTIVSTPATGAADWTGWITQQGLTDRGFMRASLTNFAASAASSVAAGSVMELAGSIYSFTETAISLAAGTASAAVAVYYTVIPAVGGTTCTVVMDDTAPTWVDGKQGWYASAASLTRYIGGTYLASITSFSGKWLYSRDTAPSRMRVTKNNAQTISHNTTTIIQYDDEDFDNLGEFASYTFTAKEAGYYFVAGGLESVAVAWGVDDIWQIRLYKNGAIYSYGSRNSGAAETYVQKSILSDIIKLGATEYIDIRCYHNQGGDVNTSAVAAANYFSVYRLS